MRLFYAAFLDPEHRHAFAERVAAVRREIPRAIRPVPADTHHVTLGFLGEVAEEGVAACRDALSRIEGFAAIAVTLGSPRILSGRGRPRLVCVDVVEGGNEVDAIQRRLVEETRVRLAGVDLRPKPPHVTIARFRKGVSRETGARVAEAFARLEREEPPRRDRFERVRLVRSRLTREGPIYEAIAEAVLSGPH